MPECSKRCKHNHLNFCTKYNKPVIVSHNIWHQGLLIHPLHYLTIYYNYNQKDISSLIKLAKTYLTDNTSKNLFQFYDSRNYLTFKQRKLLLHQIFECYEPQKDETVNDGFCQVD